MSQLHSWRLLVWASAALAVSALSRGSGTEPVAPRPSLMTTPPREGLVSLLEVEVAPDPNLAALSPSLGEPLIVRGAFQVSDPTLPPDFAIAEIAFPNKQKKGSWVTAHAALVKEFASLGDGKYRFEFRMQAPGKKGRYTLRIKPGGQHVAGTREIEVEADSYHKRAAKKKPSA